MDNRPVYDSTVRDSRLRGKDGGDSRLAIRAAYGSTVGIPAYAGMTVGAAGWQSGRHTAVPFGIPAYAGRTVGTVVGMGIV